MNNNVTHGFMTPLYFETNTGNNKAESKKAEEEKRDVCLLPHISSHILRHTACTRMAEAGIDVKILQ